MINEEPDTVEFLRKSSERPKVQTREMIKRDNEWF